MQIGINGFDFNYFFKISYVDTYKLLEAVGSVEVKEYRVSDQKQLVREDGGKEKKWYTYTILY